MKKTYIAPSVEIQETDTVQMMALSLEIGGTGTSGEEADVREQAWGDIWSTQIEDIDDEE